jgi:hypothetical protein
MAAQRAGGSKGKPLRSRELAEALRRVAEVMRPFDEKLRGITEITWPFLTDVAPVFEALSERLAPSAEALARIVSTWMPPPAEDLSLHQDMTPSERAAYVELLVDEYSSTRRTTRKDHQPRQSAAERAVDEALAVHAGPIRVGGRTYLQKWPRVQHRVVVLEEPLKRQWCLERMATLLQHDEYKPTRGRAQTPRPFAAGLAPCRQLSPSKKANAEPGRKRDRTQPT